MSGSYLKTKRARFLVECLDLQKVSGVEDAKWEHFQLAHLNDEGRFRIEDKSRQIAWSFLIAGESIADALVDGRDSIFVSINLEEAKEKIRYARRVYDALQIVGLPTLKTDNQLELEFSNGARIISHPSKAPRGKAQSNVYLDEFAHVMRDRSIYKGSLPIIAKGGRLRIGSSPLGASGVFWELFTQNLKVYSGYTRKKTPWWEVQAFSLNVKEAIKLAPQLNTFQRVEIFGKDTIKAIYANMVEEDFQQEFEAEFVDETTAWISWDEIKANQDDNLICFSATAKKNDLSKVFEAVEKVEAAIATNAIERVFAGGCDIGRTRNATEIYLIGESTTSQFPLRLMLTLDNCEFDNQLGVIKKVLELPVHKLLIDQNGIGRNLAENAMKSFPSKVEGVNFTNESKKLWATDVKMFFQQNKVPIPVDRDLAYQIHSIKKIVSASKNLIFDTDRNEKHHADKFWALALALNAGCAPGLVVTDRERQMFQNLTL